MKYVMMTIFQKIYFHYMTAYILWLQDEPELKVASLWHEAAVNSTNSSEKLLNFQNSIETLVVG